MGKKDDYHTTANNRLFVHFIILLLLKSMHLLAINIKYWDINPALLYNMSTYIFKSIDIKVLQDYSTN